MFKLLSLKLQEFEKDTVRSMLRVLFTELPESGEGGYGSSTLKLTPASRWKKLNYSERSKRFSSFSK